MSLDAREPDRIEDLNAAAQLAGLSGSTDTRTVTLTGRCGDCGYMLASAGHEITCT